MDLAGLVLGQGPVQEQALGPVLVPGLVLGQDQVLEQEQEVGWGLGPVPVLSVQGLGLVPGLVLEQERGWGLGWEPVQEPVQVLVVAVALCLTFLMAGESTKWGGQWYLGGTITGRSRRLGIGPLIFGFPPKEESGVHCGLKFLDFVFLHLNLPLGQQQATQLEQVVEPNLLFMK